MTTVINNPGQNTESDSGAGLIIGVIIAIVLIALFVIYGLPALRQQSENNDGTVINVEIPSPTDSNDTNQQQ